MKHQEHEEVKESSYFGKVDTSRVILLRFTVYCLLSQIVSLCQPTGTEIALFLEETLKGYFKKGKKALVWGLTQSRGLLAESQCPSWFNWQWGGKQRRSRPTGPNTGSPGPCK